MRSDILRTEDRIRTRFAVAAVLVVALAGALKLAEPLGGDQSLFLIGAQAMRHGALLYRDFWDLKQPAIYLFYYLATAIGQYSAVAVHVTELFYLLTFSVVIIAMLRKSTTFRSVAELVPVATVAFYYLATTSFEAIQVESVVGFPLFATLCCFAVGSESRRTSERFSWYFVGGAVAALVLSFKIVFAPIVAALWLASNRACLRGPRGFPFAIIQSFAATMLGFGVAAAFVLFPFARDGTVDLAFQTWFVIPADIVRAVPHQQAFQLFGGIRWFVDRYAGLLLLAIVGIAGTLRSKPDAFAIGALAWLATATVVVLIQVTSWFQYQWLLLSVPVGMFAALGARVLLRRAVSRTASATRRLLAIGVLFVCAGIAPGALLVRTATPLVRNHLALTANDRESYREAVSFVYASLRPEAALITPGTASLYVIGDPSLYVIARRQQPLPLNGSSVRLFLPNQWRELDAQIASVAPRYIFISTKVTIGFSQLRERVARQYRLKHRGGLGALYERRLLDTAAIGE